MSDLNTLKTLIDQSFTAVAAKGVSVSGVKRKNLPAKIAEISTGSPTLPDLVAGGTYHKHDGTPVVINPISGETTAIRLLVAATGPMRTALVLTFTGSPVIDWGDGTTTTPTSGVAAVHQYDGVNPIPCGRPWGVYYITINGGTVTAIASSASRDDWGSAVGNIISVAIKSTTISNIEFLVRSNGASIFQYAVENLYYNVPNILSFNQIFSVANRILNASLICPTAKTFSAFAQSVTPSQIVAFDGSQCMVLSDFIAPYFFGYASSIFFNPANTELGNVNIQYNSLSVSGFVALFNSLPIVTAKTIQIGGSAAALALTAEQLAIATNKGWTVTRSY